ncbi:ATP-binding protein [Peribacillus sp. YIM B13472]|uniref:ATP-binding protein n=1 Tax=Peribacillus sp. YIM B13472 TaxID=3366297 RepID=UPI00366B1843
MPIITEVISSEIVQTILALEEDHFSDLKSFQIKPAKLSRTIAAFANADGGELYIGINEEEVDGNKVRKWDGFSDIEAANGHIQIFEQLFPLGQDFNYTFLKNKECNGLVLKVEVFRTREIVKASDGKPYKRRGAQSLPVDTAEDIDRLRYDKGIVSFETETIDIDVERISESDTIQKYLPIIAPTQEPEKWLKKQFLIRDGKPTVGGILLFDDEPQAILPKRSSVKIYRYTTLEPKRESLAFEPITIEGCIYQQIADAVNTTINKLEDIKVLTATGFSNVKYPEVALQEIITNAVLHRDYSIAADTHIRIFDNRIEIESPGKLPGHITVTNILNEQLARNGSIVRLIHKFPNPPNKDVGEGLDAAFEAMVDLRLKEPIIEERENSVIVFIRHEPLDSPADIIAEFLSHHSEINNSKARQICHIGSENVMKRIFQKMMESGIIERIPERKGNATAYRLVENNN